MATSQLSPDEIAATVVGRRRRFADALRRDAAMSTEQWQPLARLLLISEERTNLYCAYPVLFADAFPGVPPVQLRELSWCGRAAIDYLLICDHLLDRREPPAAVHLLTAFAFQREYLCGLRTLFPASPRLWAALAECEQETARALAYEDVRRRGPLAPFTLDDYRRQAIGRSALSRLAIVALAELGAPAPEERVRGLIESNDLYHFGNQVIDDVVDWRRDLTTGSLSFVLAATLRELGAGESSPADSYPPEEVGRQLYGSIAEEYLAAAEAALAAALDLARRHGPCPHWEQAVERRASVVSAQLQSIAEVKRRLEWPRVPARAAAASSLDSAVADAVDAGTGFLLDRFEAGCWRDFATSAGISEDWTTGFVGWTLAHMGRLPDPAAREAVTWLMGSQFEEGGWGYHRHVVPDADSTAWSLRFLNLAAPAEVDQGRFRQVLNRHQRPGGGFSTYAEAAPIRAFTGRDGTADFSGWCGPHPCVTAVVLLALLDLTETSSPLFQAAYAHLLSEQRREGFWRSYWWIGPHYATAYALQVLCRVDAAANAERVRAARRWVLGAQTREGGWGATPGQPAAPFFTALALQGLLAGDRTAPGDDDARSLEAPVSRGADWLLRAQEADGSWRASAWLVVPLPDEREPWARREWPIETRDVGSTRNDHRRLFTTGTVLAALHRVAANARRCA
jgi:hypothetical protein